MPWLVINILWPLETTFDGYILLTAAIYYFRLPYTAYSAYILILMTIYYFRRLYIIFDVYILLLSLPDCGFVRIQNFLAISLVYWIKATPECSINLLALIHFCFFCSSMVSSTNFNVPFWKCCLISNTQMLKMRTFRHLALQMVRKTNK